MSAWREGGGFRIRLEVLVSGPSLGLRATAITHSGGVRLPASPHDRAFPIHPGSSRVPLTRAAYLTPRGCGHHFGAQSSRLMHPPESMGSLVALLLTGVSERNVRHIARDEIPVLFPCNHIRACRVTSFLSFFIIQL